MMMNLLETVTTAETAVLRWLLEQQPRQIYMWQKLQLLCILMCEQLLNP